MLDLSTTKGKIGLATGAVFGVFGVYLVARKTNKKKSIDKKKLLAIFSALSGSMQQVIMQIAAQEKQVRANAAQQGRKISNEEM